MTRIASLFSSAAALCLVVAPAYAQQKPLVEIGGQVVQLPAGEVLAVPTSGVAMAKVMAHVTNNTALRATPSAFGSVVRTGYAAAGDAPALIYSASSSACSLNAGMGDGGWQIPSSDGKCWIAQFGAAADIRQWGLQPGGQADAALNAAIAFACAKHVPVTIPYPMDNPYLVNSQITIGNGSSTALSTCNGVSIRVEQAYLEATSGTSPPGALAFRWNGTSPNTVPFVFRGPMTTVTASGISVNCAHPSNNAFSCKTGIKIDTVMNMRAEDFAVEGNRGPAFEVTSTPVNTWGGGMEGSILSRFHAIAPGAGGSGALIGNTTCGVGACTIATIKNTFSNWTLNYDHRDPSAYGIKFGLASQNMFSDLTVVCFYLWCQTPQPHAIVIAPPPGDTAFPENNMMINPTIMGGTDDPGAAWTGTNGFTFVNWSRVWSPFPTSTQFDLFKGTDSFGLSYPGARNWTPADNSGAGLSFTVADATYSLTGNTCTVSLALTFPATANGSPARIGGLPARCRPLAGSGTSRAGGTVSYTTYSAAPITAVMDNTGAINLYAFGGTGVSNTGMSGKILRMSFNFPIN